jgi:hypothetical protein
MEEGASVHSIDGNLCETCSKLSSKPTLHNRKVDDFELGLLYDIDGVQRMAVGFCRVLECKSRRFDGLSIMRL